MKRKQHTFIVTVSAPEWATRADVQREVRTLVNDQCTYGTLSPDGNNVIEDGDIKVRSIKAAPKEA